MRYGLDTEAATEAKAEVASGHGLGPGAVGTGQAARIQNIQTTAKAACDVSRRVRGTQSVARKRLNPTRILSNDGKATRSVKASASENGVQRACPLPPGFGDGGSPQTKQERLNCRQSSRVIRS